MPVEELHEEDVDTEPFRPERPARLWEPDSSGEEVFFIRTRDHDTQVEVVMRDVGVQTSTWQYYSSDELESEIAFRLSDDAFAMLHTADFEFPWMAFTTFMVSLAAVVSCTTGLLVRWWQSRRVMPVEESNEEDVDTAPFSACLSCSPLGAGFVWRRSVLHTHT